MLALTPENQVTTRAFRIRDDEADAADILEAFCQWQDQERSRWNQTSNHDLAVLITRRDLCKQVDAHSCSTLGLGTCPP